MRIQAGQLKGLRWYNDAGHGWLAVPVRVLLDSGVAGQISACSHIDRQTAIAYLEEDCDAPLFLEAMGIASAHVKLPEENLDDGQCFIRRLPAFSLPEGWGQA